MIIFLSGSINSGKSTVSKLLVQKLPSATVIDVDDLDKDIRHIPIDDRIMIRIERAIVVIREAVGKFENIIVTNILRQDHFELMKRELTATGHEFVGITLDPGLEGALTNRGTREITDWERERIKYHYRIGIHKPGYGFVVDSSNQTPAETVAEILAKL